MVHDQHQADACRDRTDTVISSSIAELPDAALLDSDLATHEEDSHAGKIVVRDTLAVSRRHAGGYALGFLPQYCLLPLYVLLQFLLLGGRSWW